MTFIFPKTVRVKSPHNILARRYHRCLQAAWSAERQSWSLFLANGSRVEVPADHLVHFGKEVSIT